MKYAMAFGLAAVLAAAGCDKKTEPSKPADKGGDKKGDGTGSSGHAHGKGPNGGAIFDLGKYHAEFTVNHDKKECTILILGDDEKTPVAVAATELTVSTKEAKTKDGKVVAPMTVTLKPVDARDGKATKFVGTDPGIGNVADFEGAVTGEIDGKPSKGEFKEE
jgi:hypothetical protein